MDEQILDEIFGDLAANLVDLSDEEIAQKLDGYDLDPEDREEILRIVKDVRDAEAVAAGHEKSVDTTGAVASGAAETAAQEMANGDSSEVTVEETDKDNDGDPDKITIEQKGNEDDNPVELEYDDDEPHDQELSDEEPENLTNSIAKVLSEYKW